VLGKIRRKQWPLHQKYKNVNEAIGEEHALKESTKKDKKKLTPKRKKELNRRMIVKSSWVICLQPLKRL